MGPGPFAKGVYAGPLLDLCRGFNDQRDESVEEGCVMATTPLTTLRWE